MKKFICIMAIGIGFGLYTTSCSTMKTASSVASLAGFDVNSISKGVMGALTPSLGLNSQQQPGVGSAVTDFLTKKSDIIGLQKSDPAAYASKFGSMFGGLKSKLGGILTASQMSKFLSLKPKTNDISNVMSNLFY